MVAHDWLSGSNLPPHLEALPPPQLAPRVQWDHSPTATPVAPVASPAAAAPAAAVPSHPAEPAPEPSVSTPRDSPPNEQQNPDGEAGAIAREVKKNREEGPVASSESPEGALVGETAVGGGEGNGDSSQPRNGALPSRPSWRGSAPKIKASDMFHLVLVPYRI